MASGTLYGVGVGPGDPELVTMKAARVLSAVRTVAHFTKRGHDGNALTTARNHLRSDAELVPLVYPYTVELSPRDPEYARALRTFYDASAQALSARLASGHDVAVLCEGDPLLYGSYMYLHDRLAARHPTSVIPGITSFSGAAARAGLPLVSTDRVFSIVPGTLPEAELEARLAGEGAAAVLKLGKNFAKVRRVLDRLGKLDGATFVERATTGREQIVPLRDKLDDHAIYFSLILVPAHDGGPYRPRAEEAP